MRFQKVIAAVVASCVMATSAATLVKSVSALSSDSPVSSTDVTVELIGLTDEYTHKVPLKTIIDNMTYTHDVFEDASADKNDKESAPESDIEDATESVVESAPDSAVESDPESAVKDDPESTVESDTDSTIESDPE
ncbi:MAG: hypothetical protein K2J80_04610, partial [Oscillospiraceae bacterium]|nr:hypothetical protein [Oscillospiraceae bacterium]